MIFSAILFSFLILIPLFLSIVLALFLWENRNKVHDTFSTKLLFGILIGESFYSSTYCFELFLPDSTGYSILVFFRYLGMILFMFLMLLFVFRYLGFWTIRSRLTILILGIPGLLSLIVIGTNPLHHLFYPEIDHITEGVHHFTHTNGPLYMPIQVFGYFLLILIILLLIVWLISSPRSYSTVIWILLAGCISPLIGMILYHTGIRPFGYINLIPYSFIITTVMFSIALIQYRLHMLTPVLYKKIFNAMPAGILLVDESNNIIEINKTVLDLFNLDEQEALGRDLVLFLEKDHPVLTLLSLNDREHMEYTHGDQTLFITKTIQTGENGEVIRTLIIFTDITRQKADEKVIQKNELLLRSTFASTNDGILIVGINHQITPRAYHACEPRSSAL